MHAPDARGQKACSRGRRAAGSAHERDRARRGVRDGGHERGQDESQEAICRDGRAIAHVVGSPGRSVALPPVRILLASPGMGLGGAERVVVALAHGLTARGHEVAVSGAPGPLDAELRARRLMLPERGRSPLGVLEWAAREAAFVRAFRPHVVHAHNAKATVIAAAAAPARPRPAPPAGAGHPPRRGTGADRAARRAAAAARGRRGRRASPRTPARVRAAAPRVIHNGIAARAAAVRRTGHDGRAVRRPARPSQEPGALPATWPRSSTARASRSSATARCAPARAPRGRAG